MWSLLAILLWLVAPYALAVATPSWRWLLAYVVVVGGWLAYGFLIETLPGTVARD
jgi:hypothetical protein